MLTKEDRAVIQDAPHHYRDFWRWACPCGKGFTDVERYYAHQDHCFAWGHPEKRRRNSLGGYACTTAGPVDTTYGDNEFSVDSGESFWPHMPKAVGAEEYFITLYEGVGKQPKKKTVLGQRVTIPGFEEFHFFLHAAPYGGGYRISEATTGGSVGNGGTNKAAAIADATIRLEKLGIDHLRRILGRP